MQVTDLHLVLVVAVQAAEKYAVEVHDGHVVPALALVVGRDDGRVPIPPMAPGIVVGRFDLKNCCAAVRQGDKVVHVGQHTGVPGAAEHLFDLEYWVPGLLGKDAGNQIFQQMSHLQCDPVAGIILCGGNAKFVIVEVADGSPGRNSKDSCGVTAADSFAPPGQPLCL